MEWIAYGIAGAALVLAWRLLPKEHRHDWVEGCGTVKQQTTVVHPLMRRCSICRLHQTRCYGDWEDMYGVVDFVPYVSGDPGE